MTALCMLSSMRTLQSMIGVTIGLFCTQGFTMIPGSGANSRLALTAHYKAFLHAALMAAAGSASSAVSAWSQR